MIRCWGFFTPPLLSPVISPPPPSSCPTGQVVFSFFLPNYFPYKRMAVAGMETWQDLGSLWWRGKQYPPSFSSEVPFFTEAFILKPLTWMYIVKLKRLNYALLATAKIHEGSEPQLVSGYPKLWFYVLFCFVFLSHEHMLTRLVSSMWYGNDWKYTVCCLIKTSAKRRTARSFGYVSRGPGDEVEPG